MLTGLKNIGKTTKSDTIKSVIQLVIIKSEKEAVNNLTIVFFHFLLGMSS